MNIVDSIIILTLLLGAVIGFKTGIIQNLVSFIGTILVIIISFMLKDQVAEFLYTYLPFNKIGIPIVNVLIYETLAFLLIFTSLVVILKMLIRLSGLIEKFLDVTIVLAIPSKILGAIFGFLETYLIVFIVLLALSAFNYTNSYITSSKIADYILTHTPFMSKALNNTYNAIKEVISLNQDYEASNDKNGLENKATEIMLKYNIITKENINKLVEKGKLNPIKN